MDSPAPSRIRCRSKEAVEADERHEQRVALHLAREGMRRDERIARLEVGPGGVDHGIRWTVGRYTAHGERKERGAHGDAPPRPC